MIKINFEGNLCSNTPPQEFPDRILLPDALALVVGLSAMVEKTSITVNGKKVNAFDRRLLRDQDIVEVNQEAV